MALAICFPIYPLFWRINWLWKFLGNPEYKLQEQTFLIRINVMTITQIYSLKLTFRQTDRLCAMAKHCHMQT